MDKKFSIIMPWDADRGTWGPSIVHEGNPLPRVRTLLGGKWTRSLGRLDGEEMSAAFWNETNGRRAFVLDMPKGLPLDAVYRIAEARP